MKYEFAMKIGLAAAGAVLLCSCGSSKVTELSFLQNGSTADLIMYYRIEGESDGMLMMKDNCEAYSTDAAKKFCQENMETASDLLCEIQEDLKDASYTKIGTDEIDESQLAYYFEGQGNALAYFYRNGRIKVVDADRNRTAYTCDKCSDIIEECDDAVEELNENEGEYVEETYGSN